MHNKIFYWLFFGGDNCVKDKIIRECWMGINKNDKIMKILVLSDTCFNDNVIPMFKSMQEKGLDVTCLINLNFDKMCLINIEKHLPKQAIIKATEYPELKIFERYLDTSKLYLINHIIDRKHAWRDLTCAIDIYNFIKKGKYDVIHTDMVFWRSKILLYVFRNKIVQITHDSFPHSSQILSWQRSFYMYLKYKLIKRFVILNKTDYLRFCEVHKLRGEQVYINTLGPYDFIRIYQDASIKPQKGNILFFGRIESYKGIEYLCEAVEKLHQTIPYVNLTIAGSGQFYFNIERYKELPYVTIINRYIEERELAELIQRCEMSICAYTDATQSGSVLTSFSFYKPVIGSDIETMREVIKNEYNGLLVPPKNPNMLADAIARLLTDKELKERIQKNVEYEFHNGEKSWSKIVDKYLEIYKSVVYNK